MESQVAEKKHSVVRIEGSTLCQLRCPTCPTTEGKTHAHLGAGFLTRDNFQRLVDQGHPEETIFELANYGEVFLNPHLPDILRIAREHNHWVSCYSGANLNSLKDHVAEAVVRHQMLGILCSIDGASDETYRIYRRRGHFSNVIANVKKINEYKRKHGAPLPHLIWQFVVFGHNEHEIDKARAMAEELGMGFLLKQSWDATISPVNAASPFQSAQWKAAADEKLENAASTYDEQDAHGVCHQLWTSPQINYDGRVLGCCNNYWGDFGGNAFEDLPGALQGEKIRYARAMLRGASPPRDDIPCTTCSIYEARAAASAWVSTDFASSPGT